MNLPDLPLRHVPRAPFGLSASRKNCRCLRDHLLRLDRTSRHDRFHGFMDDSFIERYAEKCANDGTVIIAYIEDGVVRGAAELHPPEQSPDSLPEIAFSVEARCGARASAASCSRKLIAEARAKGYQSLRITTGAQNEAMRALANKFGAHLTFRHGKSTGNIDLAQQTPAGTGAVAMATPIEAARAIANFNRAYWRHDVPDVWLGPRRPDRSDCANGNSRILIRELPLRLEGSQVPVRLSLPKRRTTRRSTTTERCAPCSPAITRVADRAAARPVFFTSARTSSIRQPHQRRGDFRLLLLIVGNADGGEDCLLQRRRIAPHAPGAIFRVPVFAHQGLASDCGDT